MHALRQNAEFIRRELSIADKLPYYDAALVEEHLLELQKVRVGCRLSSTPAAAWRPPSDLPLAAAL